MGITLKSNTTEVYVMDFRMLYVSAVSGSGTFILSTHFAQQEAGTFQCLFYMSSFLIKEIKQIKQLICACVLNYRVLSQVHNISNKNLKIFYY